MLKFIAFTSIFLSTSFAFSYPEHWWKPVPESTRHGDWEILPQAASERSGEVILSKRNELGVFSNFGHTPFKLNGDTFASIEGFWQMMKYPDPKDSNDPRLAFVNEYPHTRAEVASMHGFTAKEAGDSANLINRKHNIKNVSYKKRFFNYKDFASGSTFHLDLMEQATKAKVMQNTGVKKLLLETKGLVLRPDHLQGENVPPSYAYYKILMAIRDKL